MAEINISSKHDGNRRRPKKLSTRVDLTPMVDLGFLLITFFIFTTSMSEPRAMKLNLPADPKKDDSLVTAEGKTLSLIIGGDKRIYYYMGNNLTSLAETAFGANNIRKIIGDKKRRMANVYGDPKELVILLKPTKQASYQNIVRIIDEMLINDVGKYILMEPNKNELATVPD